MPRGEAEFQRRGRCIPCLLLLESKDPCPSVYCFVFIPIVCRLNGWMQLYCNDDCEGIIFISSFKTENKVSIIEIIT